MLLPLPQGPRSKETLGSLLLLQDATNAKNAAFTQLPLLSSCISVYLGFERWFQGLLGSPVVRTPCFLCRGNGSDPWSRTEDPACCMVRPKKKKDGIRAWADLWTGK